MITYDDMCRIMNRAKAQKSNEAWATGLGIDCNSLRNPELEANPYAGILMTGICVGLELAKELNQANQDHAPTENHDEFLESLPENRESHGCVGEPPVKGVPSETDILDLQRPYQEQEWADDGGSHGGSS